MSNTKISIVVLAALLAAAPPCFAQSNANAYIVHGIPGRDIGAAYSPSFPIDVSVDGECIVKNVVFGNVVGPVAIPSGTVTFLLYQANETNPCSGSSILGARAQIAPGETISAVAGETANRALGLNLFPVDLTPVAASFGRVIVYHQADAPTLDVVGVALTADQTNVTFSDIGMTGTLPGQGKVATLPTDTWYVGRLTLSGTAEPVYGPPASVGDRTVEIVYLLGSAATGSLTVLGTLVPDVY